MTHSQTKLTFAFVLAAALVVTAFPASAAGTNETKKAATATTDKKPAAKKPTATKFTGTVSAVDTNAMTLSVTNKSSSHVLHLTSKTSITINGKPATLSQTVVGDTAAGSYAKGDGDVLNLVTAKLTPKAEPKKPATAKKDTATDKKAAPKP